MSETENIATSKDIFSLKTLISSEVGAVQSTVLALRNDVEMVQNEVENARDDISQVRSDVASFKVRFEEFVEDLEKKNNITHAQGQIVILNQQLEKEYGAYEKVRKNLLGILQAVDTGLVSKQAITNSTEELMLQTPRYWLAPSLIALAGWINNNQELAQRALNEGLTRHKLKTILIFTLICNRLKRQDASFMWLSKYFEDQNPLEMPQETLILVNAYTDGVFGPDSEGECLVQIKNWLSYLAEQPDKVKELEEKWIAKIEVMPFEGSSFEYLSKYCKDYNLLIDLLNKSRQNGSFMQYLKNIMDAQKEEKDYTEELDDILFKLVREYDEDEFVLRKKHRMCELILKYEGDKELAEQDFDANVVTMFEKKVTFFDILNNAIAEETSSPSLRKLALILMKEWILNAHNDFVAKYRMNYPAKITFEINNWSGDTSDGSNVDDLTESYKSYLKITLDKKLKEQHPNYFLIIALVGSLVWAIYSSFGGISMYLFFALIFGLGINIYMVMQNRKELIKQFNKNCDEANSILNALCAEFVDWQKQYKEADNTAGEISPYLNNLNSEDFSKNSADKKILI